MDKDQIFSALNAKAFKTFEGWRNSISKELLTKALDEAPAKPPRYKHDALFQKDQGHGLPDDGAKKREVLKMFGKGTATVGEEVEELDEIDTRTDTRKIKRLHNTMHSAAKVASKQGDKFSSIMNKISVGEKKRTNNQKARLADRYHKAEGHNEEVENEGESLDEKKMSRHTIAVKAHKGENVGHGGFKKVEAKAAKEYGSEAAGKRVAAAEMWKKYAKEEYGLEEDDADEIFLEAINLGVADDFINEWSRQLKRRMNQHVKDLRKSGAPSDHRLAQANVDRKNKTQSQVKRDNYKERYHEEEFDLDEHLGKNASLKTDIDDFVHSTNSKFDGKSKKERIKMALGKYYGDHKEEVELDELNWDTHNSYTKKAYKARAQASHNARVDDALATAHREAGNKHIAKEREASRDKEIKTAVKREKGLNLVHKRSKGFFGHSEEVEIDESDAVSKLPKANMSPPDRAGERNTRASKIATDKLKKTAKMNETPDLSDLLKKNFNLDETNKIPGTGISSRKEKHSMNKHVSDSRAIGSYKNTASIIKQSKRTNKQIERGTHKEEVELLDEHSKHSYEYKNVHGHSAFVHIHRSGKHKTTYSHIPVIPPQVGDYANPQHPIDLPDCRGDQKSHETHEQAEKELKKAGYTPNGHITIDRYPDLKRLEKPRKK